MFGCVGWRVSQPLEKAVIWCGVRHVRLPLLSLAGQLTPSDSLARVSVMDYSVVITHSALIREAIAAQMKYCAEVL